MKTKLLAIVLSMLMLVQPVMAIGMVGMESADEVSSVVEIADEEIIEEAELAADYSYNPAILVKEDFDNGFTIGQKFSYKKDGTIGSAATIGRQSSYYDMAGATFNGEKVLKVFGTSSNWAMTGIQILQLPLVGAGQYELTLDYYLESGTYSNYWNDSLGWGQVGYSNVLALGTWKTVTLKFDVTQNASDATKFDVVPYSPTGTAAATLTAQASLNVGSLSVTTSSKEAQFSYYVDNITFKKIIPATVTYVDEAGTTLATVSKNVGETFKVGDGITVGYTPAYTVDGVKVYAGDNVTVTGDMTVNVAKYVFANKPATAVLYEDFENVSSNWVYDGNTFSYDASQTGTKASFIGTDRTGASATMSKVVDTKTVTDNAVATNGTRAFMLKNKVNNYSLTGFTIKNLPLENVGEYEFSYKAFVVDVKETNIRSTTTYIGSEGVYLAPVFGEWKTFTTYITVTEAGGVKTASIKTSQGKVFDIALTNGVLATNMQFIWVGDATKTEGYYTIYLDDITLAYKEPAVPATVTYVDGNGATIGIVDTSVGETFKVGDGITVGYVPVYTINGVKVNAGDVVTVTGDMTVNVTKYVPENIPANAIIYEDFEGYTVGATVKNGITNYVSYGKGVHSTATLGTDGATGTYTTDPTGTNKALKVTSDSEFDACLTLYTPFTDIGIYTVSYKWYVAANNTAIPKVNLWGRVWAGTEISEISNSAFTDNETRNSWQTRTYTVEIYEENGQKMVKTNGGKKAVTSNVNPMKLYTAVPAASATNLVDIYLDDFCITYKTNVTLTYVDEAGATIKSVSALTGDVVTLDTAKDLGINYKAIYTVNGAKVKAGDEITLNGNVTVNVAKYVAENVPANAIFFENFEAYDEYADTTVRFSDIAAYTAGQATGARLYETYNNGTQSVVTANGSKVFKQSDSAEYSAGISIDGLAISEPGVYTLSFKYLATLPEGSDVTSGQFFFRFNDRNIVVVNDEWSRIYETAFSADEWKTFSKSFEIYYENGVKMIKGNGYSAALPAAGITAIQGLYIPNKSHVAVTYYDDICLTYEYEAPAVVNAYFVTQNGESFAYTAHSENGSLVLPTAAQLGVDYEPCYTYNNNVYYAGQSFNFDEDTEIEYIVTGTNVVYKADFENDTVRNSGAEGADHKLTVAGGVGYYDAATANGGKWNSYNASGFNFDKPGKYAISVDLKLDPKESGATAFATYFYLYGATANDGESSVYNANWPAGQWNNINVEFDVYEKDGELYYKNVNGKELLLKNGNFTKIGFGGDIHATAASTARMYFDNFVVTFTPYAPALVNKASYKVAGENGKPGPAGIRFASYVTEAQYEASTEFGFVVTRKTFIGDDYTKLNLKGVTVTDGIASAKNEDGVLVIAAAAYNGFYAKIYDFNGSTFGTEYMGLEEMFFTGVLTGIPAGYEDDVFVARPYIKIGGNVYYGECIERCYNDFAAAINS